MTTAVLNVPEISCDHLLSPTGGQAHATTINDDNLTARAPGWARGPHVRKR
jgi:hypothetical protein